MHIFMHSEHHKHQNAAEQAGKTQQDRPKTEA